MRKSSGRLLALSLGIVLAGAATASAGMIFSPNPVRAILDLAESLVRPNTPGHAFGFQAYYVLPVLRPGDWCGTNNGGPTTWPWAEGPHTNFEDIVPSRLARESLAWFEFSSVAAAWWDRSTARLELVYPSEGRTVTARYDRSLELSWEQQLLAWFTRFPARNPEPPFGAEALAGQDGDFSWRLDFGNSGKVRGRAGSAPTAVKAMRTLVRNRDSSRIFRQPSFSLGQSVRRAPRQMDYYSVDADRVEELGDLPGRLLEKRKKYAYRDESSED